MKLDEGHVYILNDVDDITGPSYYTNRHGL